MSLFRRRRRRLLTSGALAGALLATWSLALAGGGAAAARGVAADPTPNAAATTSPIKHVVVIIGENHTFDNVFATYQPPAGQKIWNLRSEGIVTANGTPGPDFGKATQLTAS